MPASRNQQVAEGLGKVRVGGWHGDMTDIADQQWHDADVDDSGDGRGALTAAGLSCA